MLDVFFKQSNLDFDKSSFCHKKDYIFVNAYFIPEDEKCPVCDSDSLYKNGHTYKTVKHCVYRTNLILVKCNFQIYKCKVCHHIFREKNTFSPYNFSLSYESIMAILDDLKSPNSSFESIAKSFHISKQNVIDVFDYFYTYTPPTTLPQIISFDEKHIGKAITDHKYLFVMVDWKNKKIYDILQSRDKATLWKYFGKIPKESRDKVEYITMDMWASYKDVASFFFRNAKIAVDSFHVMENINRAMNRVRCSVMAKFNKKTENIEDNHLYYYLLKKFDYFFTKEFDDICDLPIRVQKLKTKLHKNEIMKYLLDIDIKLNEAYELTSKYREFNRTANINNCKEELDELIDLFLSSSLEQFKEVGNTLFTWKNEIINSFITINDSLTIPKNKYDQPKERRLSNGLIEGLNSIIEQIKINGKGYTNYERFKKRIIYVINKELVIKGNPKK